MCYFPAWFSLGGQDHLLARAGLFGLAVLPRQVLSHRLTGELGLAGVAEVPGQVQSLAWAHRTEGGGREGGGGLNYSLPARKALSAAVENSIVFPSCSERLTFHQGRE